ncbi:MAG: 2-oxoacid:acceptor oxidoreductase subunit alpha [Deltaproteobacteria bacterium]|nr:2-oxoacid:acceptor oxidoreductase subunit alpha [Deltaproteobacteria bacterium]MBW1958478.1 2-oxoacid:acceptor oxidoreductase subunit alpha [Deltaproteobacteria bacterium]MBW2013986.1 2-oxoacid:acceptor oxidoreductase subunit alpha [Deltaproteobacteria bacterium]MBW2089364.1 2-oxoacid:acceptor oxidoreductase subunit alpha [Deltaproteobacteria bacterium]MBW2319941.1 2-oxoacid:acceptor oxidoreductase subunit alpha [Deltaproteobacteria bacterium]
MKNKNIKFVQGNEVCVEGALYAGLDFFAGYPITPSTEIAELLSYRLPQKGGKFIQMEDEIASMCAIIGASLTGSKVMTATSGPGFSLMQEALGYAIMAEIPCVIVNVQRGGPSTGIPTHVSQGDVNQARWGTHGDHAIVTITASNHQDVFETTVDAFNISETYRTPVILLYDEILGHMRERLLMPEPGELPLVERLRTSVREGVDYHPYLPREDGRLPMSDFGGVHRYNVTGLFHDMWGFPSDNPKIVHGLLRHLVDKIQNNVNQIARYKEYFLEDAECILISYGSSARSANHVVVSRRPRGERLGLLELQTLWPFPYDLVREKCANAKYIVVVEMNMGQIMQEVRKAVDQPEKVFLANRIDGVFITPTNIRDILRLIQGKGV